jgi:hypothetical protein
MFFSAIQGAYSTPLCPFGYLNNPLVKGMASTATCQSKGARSDQDVVKVPGASDFVSETNSWSQHELGDINPLDVRLT